MEEKEECEWCKKEITQEMKESQEVIYASAEHTMSSEESDNPINIPYRDEMFSGVFCSQECFNEIIGINKAYKAGQLAEQQNYQNVIEKARLNWINEGVKQERERCLKVWNKLKSRNKSMREETGFSLKMDDLEEELTKKVSEVGR